MDKQNCWEFKKCGRQPSGVKSSLGVCPAASEKRLDGTHGGKNAGRACWVISGTMCNGEVQGTFAKKYKNCETCDFYNSVEREEGPGFKMSLFLLNKLREAQA